MSDRYVPLSKRLGCQIVAYAPVLNDDVRRRAQVREGMQPYFADGWFSLDLPRHEFDTNAIRDAASQFGICDPAGTVVGTFDTFAEAAAAQPKYHARATQPVQYDFQAEGEPETEPKPRAGAKAQA